MGVNVVIYPSVSVRNSRNIGRFKIILVTNLYSSFSSPFSSSSFSYGCLSTFTSTCFNMQTLLQAAKNADKLSVWISVIIGLPKLARNSLKSASLYISYFLISFLKALLVTGCNSSSPFFCCVFILDGILFFFFGDSSYCCCWVVKNVSIKVRSVSPRLKFSRNYKNIVFFIWVS